MIGPPNSTPILSAKQGGYGYQFYSLWYDLARDPVVDGPSISHIHTPVMFSHLSLFKGLVLQNSVSFNKKRSRWDPVFSLRCGWAALSLTV